MMDHYFYDHFNWDSIHSTGAIHFATCQAPRRPKRLSTNPGIEMMGYKNI